jgi:hypothetical protein
MQNKEMSISQLSCQDANKFLGPGNSVEYLYHYTTVEALVNGIIVKSPKNGDEICLWATHNQYMNDPTEFRLGVNLLKATIKLLEEKGAADFKDVNSMLEDYKKLFFFVCFSEQKDSLPMWNMYGGNGHGVALKFRRFQQAIDGEWIVKCEYERGNIVHRFSELKEQSLLAAITYLSLMPFILKDSAYSHEKETRFVGGFPGSPTKYRYKNGFAIPYKEIFAEKELLDSIVIGPATNQDEVEQSIRRFLDDNNFQHVKIERSQIPYRT